MIQMAILGLLMINGKFVEKVEQTLKKPNLFNPETIGIYFLGIFVILFKLILPKKPAKIVIKIIYVIIGLLFLIIAPLSLYIIITEGNSIISETMKNK
jgi:predicted membrane channel-forming protein YqfA (hemolysin III family)